MASIPPRFNPRDFLNPKYLPTWIGLGLMRITATLPYGWILSIGKALGWFSFHLLPGRRRITRTNIRLCFPELSQQEQQKLIKQSFYDASIALLESPLAWWGSDKKLQAIHRVEGLEHLQQAQAEGKGIILLGAHYTTLEIGGRLLAYHIDWCPTFKRAHNKLFNAVMATSRQRVHGRLLASSDMRDIINYLKQNGVIWFAPDQDFGRRGSVFAPFMNVATSTLSMTARLAKTSGAKILPMYSERLPGTEGYLVRIDVPIEDLPSGDDVKDATAINRAIEDQVRRTPSQYLWGHRRFKTRPYGEPLVYAPRADKALKLYKLFMPLLSLPMILFTLWMAFKCRDRQYLLQRLGLGLPKQATKGLCLHAASVGEVNAIMPLIERLHQRIPDLPITLTTATPTGGQTARHTLPAGCVQRFLPLDWNWASQRLIRHLQPTCLLVMETEIWPNLYWNFYRNNIPLIIINGRLSKRTLNNRFYWVSRLYLFTAQLVRFVLARSDIDAERFARLGTDPELIKVMGNIKFAASKPGKTEAIDLARPYILVASTRDDEEWRIVDAWLASAASQTLLVIVPRHPNRLEHIIQQLGSKVEYIAIRSRDEMVNHKTQVYIADTFGEMGRFIAGAQFVIMGGSFVPLGGQNILECAQQARAVIFGPHMNNFNDEASLFIEHDAGLQAKDTNELSGLINSLANDRNRCQELGKNGAQLLEQYGHIIDDYIQELEILCPSFRKP